MINAFNINDLWDMLLNDIRTATMRRNNWPKIVSKLHLIAARSRDKIPAFGDSWKFVASGL